MKISNKVRSAFKSRRPVVALETAVISTGLPYPENLKVAKECEKVIKEQGAVPATIGIVDGKVKIGTAIWKATSDSFIQENEPIHVIGAKRKQLILEVETRKS